MDVWAENSCPWPNVQYLLFIQYRLVLGTGDMKLNLFIYIYVRFYFTGGPQWKYALCLSGLSLCNYQCAMCSLCVRAIMYMSIFIFWGGWHLSEIKNVEQNIFLKHPFYKYIDWIYNSYFYSKRKIILVRYDM